MQNSSGNEGSNNWLEAGFEHIWLPYTQMQNATMPLPVKSASGSRILLEDGRELVDGISSWWSVCHGYQHPHIVSKMQEQLNNLSHIMFAGLAHEPAYKLASRLVDIAPRGLNRVFFADSGSVAVEVAMKMSVQYWANQGNKRKNKFICFKNGYHGETMGALSLGDPEGWTAKAFNNYMPYQYYMDLPQDEYGFAEFEDTLKAISNTVAALFIEPLVQGAGGFKFHEPDVLAEIYRIAKKYNILFVADEIMTGFWRLGVPFACNEAGITPDLMCVGKALTGGMVGLAATLASDEVFGAFLNENFEKAFLHGPTFMANPLACSAANASLDLFEQEDISGKVDKIEKYLLENTRQFRKSADVKEVRVKGALGVLELNMPDDIEQMWQKIIYMRQQFIERGVFLRPFKNVLYIMPNFNISENELDKIINAIKKVLK